MELKDNGARFVQKSLNFMDMDKQNLNCHLENFLWIPVTYWGGVLRFFVGISISQVYNSINFNSLIYTIHI
jgi:hypothetical protein